MPGTHGGSVDSRIFGPVACDCFDAHLEGELDLKGFANLKSLTIGGQDGSGQDLTSIDLSDCQKLECLELSIFRSAVEVKGLEHLTQLTALRTYFCRAK